MTLHEANSHIKSDYQDLPFILDSSHLLLGSDEHTRELYLILLWALVMEQENTDVLQSIYLEKLTLLLQLKPEAFSGYVSALSQSQVSEFYNLFRDTKEGRFWVYDAVSILALNKNTDKDTLENLLDTSMLLGIQNGYFEFILYSVSKMMKDSSGFHSFPHTLESSSLNRKNLIQNQTIDLNKSPILQNDTIYVNCKIISSEENDSIINESHNVSFLCCYIEGNICIGNSENFTLMFTRVNKKIKIDNSHSIIISHSKLYHIEVLDCTNIKIVKNIINSRFETTFFCFKKVTNLIYSKNYCVNSLTSERASSISNSTSINLTHNIFSNTVIKKVSGGFFTAMSNQCGNYRYLSFSYTFFYSIENCKIINNTNNYYERFREVPFSIKNCVDLFNNKNEEGNIQNDISLSILPNRKKIEKWYYSERSGLQKSVQIKINHKGLK